MGERDIRPIWWQRLFDFYPFFIGASGGSTLFRDNEVGFENQAAIDVFAFLSGVATLAGTFRRHFSREGIRSISKESKQTSRARGRLPQVQKFAPQ